MDAVANAAIEQQRFAAHTADAAGSAAQVASAPIAGNMGAGADEAGRLAHLQPVDALLQSLPAVHLAALEANRFSHGNPVALPSGLQGKLRVYVDGRLLGVGEPGPGGLLWPKRLVQLVA